MVDIDTAANLYCDNRKKRLMVKKDDLRKKDQLARRDTGPVVHSHIQPLGLSRQVAFVVNNLSVRGLKPAGESLLLLFRSPSSFIFFT